MENIDEIKFEAGKRQQAGMTVPEGFFEQFQLQLEAKIDEMEESKQEVPVIEMSSQKSNWIARWSIAACAVVLIGVGAFVMTSTPDESLEDVQVAAQADKDVEQSDMEEMMMHSVNDYDLYEYYCEL